MIKYVDTYRNNNGDSIILLITDIDILKYREWQGLETLLIYTLKNEWHRNQSGIYKSFRLESSMATSKPDGIDGSWDKLWSMWFNWLILPKSYLFFWLKELYRVLSIIMVLHGCWLAFGAIFKEQPSLKGFTSSKQGPMKRATHVPQFLWQKHRYK